MSFVERLRRAADYNLEYWDKRRPPKENMSRASFKRLIRILPDNIVPTWAKRKSQDGVHGLDGEEQIFQFSVEVIRFDKKKKLFMKGFFFTKEEPKGVEIQSCRWLN